MDPICPPRPGTDAPLDDPTGGPAPGPPIPKTSDLERAAREAAHALYETVLSTLVTKQFTCNETDKNWIHDYERCGTERVSNPVLLLRETRDPDEVALTDVKQGKVGDCALLATLLALANTTEGRALLKSAIVENKNDKGEVTSYTVTLHKPESHWFRATTFSEVKITVDSTFALGHAWPITQDNKTEVWPLVIEKAYAQYVGGYNTLDKGSTVDEPMQVLTGKPAKSIFLGGYSADRLKSDLAAGKLLVLETQQEILESGNTYCLVEKHAYYVTGTEVRDGRLCVALRNPWGRDAGPIPFDDLEKWFSRVGVGSVR